MCKHCPICKSTDLLFIDPIQSRQKIKNVLNLTGIAALPEDLVNLVKKLNLDEEMSEEEKVFYTLHGKKVVCKECGYTFYENDDLTDIESKEHHEVSKEEYLNYLETHTTHQDVIDFITNNSFPLKKYYIESLTQLLDEFDMIDYQTSFFNNDSSTNNLVN